MDREALAPWLGGRTFEAWREEFDERGYVVFPEVLDPAEVEAVREALAPHLGSDVRGRNDFEGFASNRVYALLAKSPVFADLAIHPLAIAFAEADLGRSCLLSACLAINLRPGETVQPWHHDDQHLTLQRPRPSCGVSAFWAIDDTTAENGATEVLPGSHRWGSQWPGEEAGVPVELPAGSLMVAKGTLWHRGGANRTDRPRLLVTPQYCPGWMRQLESMIAVVPRAIAAQLPVRARELIGYSIHPPFMGYADGVHPAKLLNTPA